VTSASGEDALDSMKVDENGQGYFESGRDLDIVDRRKASRHYRCPKLLRGNTAFAFVQNRGQTVLLPFHGFCDVAEPTHAFAEFIVRGASSNRQNALRNVATLLPSNKRDVNRMSQAIARSRSATDPKSDPRLSSCPVPLFRQTPSRPSRKSLNFGLSAWGGWRVPARTTFTPLQRV
jgi:hypothetical protein